MADEPRDGTGVVVKSLLFTAVVLVGTGIWMLVARNSTLIGVLFIAAGLVDGAMAWGLGRAA